MAITLAEDSPLAHMFNACTTDQKQEFLPDKRGFRIHGHSTTIRLEKAFWGILEGMARDHGVSLPEMIELIHDQCLFANEKNLASCLRVMCLKYINIYYA